MGYGCQHSLPVWVTTVTPALTPNDMVAIRQHTYKLVGSGIQG